MHDDNGESLKVASLKSDVPLRNIKGHLIEKVSYAESDSDDDQYIAHVLDFLIHG